ncbi:type II secretion system protein J [uncultured Clostridium sp.]|uniref:PulJ/GspJ family protein n=1 Tax=uncultured Clostridium sp. TaxID=59620 RepID=UPI002599A897|nr:prepilin-type N-terminal cleavage/methylation domain-containing protein [uncultured Clostridium sp.]
MISMMEVMEKKTPSIKKYNKKKGMTLVEIMAAMAVLSILFIGISTLIINTSKIEGRSERELESDTYLKNVLYMFESGIVNAKDLKYRDYTISFDDLEEMQSQVKDKTSVSGSKYTLRITTELKPGSNNVYKVTATIYKGKIDEITSDNEEENEKKSKFIFVEVN